MPRKTPRQPPPPAVAQMVHKRNLQREGASKNLRWYFSGPYYQARVCYAMKEAYKNVWPPLVPPRQTRSSLCLDPRLQRAINELIGLKRVIHLENNWLKNAAPPRVLDTFDLTVESVDEHKATTAKNELDDEDMTTTLYALQTQPKRTPGISLVTYL